MGKCRYFIVKNRKKLKKNVKFISENLIFYKDFVGEKKKNVAKSCEKLQKVAKSCEKL
jgi:hypothetical protein